jgi:hypothetical protein
VIFDGAEANRRNAKKSTGPRTDAGKRVSSLNAYKHGLTGQVFVMMAEEAEAHQRFTASILDDFKPVGAMEQTLARSIADSHWRINRAVIIENNMFAQEAFSQERFASREAEKRGTESSYNEVDRARAAVTSFVSDPHRFHLLTTYETRLHRKATSDLHQLRELQTARRAEEKAAQQKPSPEQKTNQQPPVPRPEPAKPVAVASQTPDLETLQPSNGFVCSPASTSLPMSEKEIEKYLMADPRDYAIRFSATSGSDAAAVRL